MLTSGLEEFEEKIDKIAEGEDDGESSWISKIYNQFSFFNDDDVENSLDENNMDGLEPPLLDETWGLGVRNTSRGEEIFGKHKSMDHGHIKVLMMEIYNICKKTMGTLLQIYPQKISFISGNIPTSRNLTGTLETFEETEEERCRVAMWRCMSRLAN